MKLFTIHLFFALLLFSCRTNLTEKPSGKDGSDKRTSWTLALEDSGTDNWQQHWTLDGLVGTVSNTEAGMHFTAGPQFKNDAHHAVLWTKESFSGDIKIEYDYIRTDSQQRCVNILYLQATGDGQGEFVTDISAWSEFREVPAMRTYFENMNALHISYAAFGNDDDGFYYVRARRYPKPDDQAFDVTRISPSYDMQGYFQTGQTYHLTAIKTDDRLSFTMDSEDGRQKFTWDLSDTKPLDTGRIGLRHMYTRSAIYKDFKIYTR